MPDDDRNERCSVTGRRVFLCDGCPMYAHLGEHPLAVSRWHVADDGSHVNEMVPDPWGRWYQAQRELRSTATAAVTWYKQIADDAQHLGLSALAENLAQATERMVAAVNQVDITASWCHHVAVDNGLMDDCHGQRKVAP